MSEQLLKTNQNAACATIDWEAVFQLESFDMKGGGVNTKPNDFARELPWVEHKEQSNDSQVEQLQKQLAEEIDNRIAAENARLYECDLRLAAQKRAEGERIAALKREAELLRIIKNLEERLALFQANSKMSFTPGVYYRTDVYMQGKHRPL